MAKKLPGDIGRVERLTQTRYDEDPPAVRAAENRLREGARLRQIRTDRIRANSLQPARRHQEVSDLATSIREHGLIHPPVVRETGEGWFEAVAGHRRIRAWQMLVFDGAMPPKIPAFVHRQLDDDRVLGLMIAENHHRQDTDVLHDAEMIGRLWSLRAEELGREPSSRELAAEIPPGKTSVHESLVIYRALQDPRLEPLVRRADTIGKRLLANVLAAPEFLTTTTALEMAVEGRPASEIEAHLRSANRRKVAKAGGRTLSAVARTARGDGYDLTFRLRKTMTAEDLDRAIEEAERLTNDLRKLRQETSELTPESH